ncbi:MAG TPA: hypothetical protein VLK30_10090 [Candidatus Limnocylindrales bacterium]|nr:hypothetical protein [Candidatus Limnocylindrales bacterium]
MPWLRRLLAVVGLASAILWLSAGAVVAGKPVPVPPPPDLTVDCGIGVGPAVLHASVDKEHMKSTTLADGTIVQKIEGRFVSTLAGNGKVLTVNSSGPATVYIRTDGSVTAVLRGRTLYITPTLDAVWLYTGLVVFDGNTGLVISHDGSATDLCAQLR